MGLPVRKDCAEPHDCAGYLATSVRNRAASVCPTVRKRAPGSALARKPLKCWSCPMMVLFCAAPEGWGLSPKAYSWYSWYHQVLFMRNEYVRGGGGVPTKGR